MEARKLIYMANQIGQFFRAQRRETAAEQIADHIEKFWDPRMRAQIKEIAAKDTGGAKLDPEVADAVRRLDGAS